MCPERARCPISPSPPSCLVSRSAADLYQLPAIERLFFNEQIFQSEHWSEFKFAELTEICRVNPAEVRHDLPNPTAAAVLVSTH